MLTVDFARFPVASGDRVLDLGCGAGRHAFEMLRRGAQVVAVDQDPEELAAVAAMFAAMEEAGEVPAGGRATAVRGDALRLPFPDGHFDRIVIAEVLEHIPSDELALAEITRVLRPGGLLAVTVPRFGPEKICWALSDEYHNNPGGHIRIYKADELRQRCSATGLEVLGGHHAHALHAPYWWLKCAVGVRRDDHHLVKMYHRMLVWDMMKAPRTTRVADRLLNPLIGKSLVVYLRKPWNATSPRTTPREPVGVTSAA